MENKNIISNIFGNYSLVADSFTVSRILVALYILFLIWKEKSRIPFDLILGILLLGWLTDALDGYFARLAKKKDETRAPTIIGKNDAIADLFLVFSINVFLFVKGFIPRNLAYIFYFIFIISIIQLLWNNSDNVFFEMVYSAVVYAWMFYYAIILKQWIWVVLAVYLIVDVLSDINHFMTRVVHFLSLGKKEIE